MSLNEHLEKQYVETLGGSWLTIWRSAWLRLSRTTTTTSTGASPRGFCLSRRRQRWTASISVWTWDSPDDVRFPDAGGIQSQVSGSGCEEEDQQQNVSWEPSRFNHQTRVVPFLFVHSLERSSLTGTNSSHAPQILVHSLEEELGCHYLVWFCKRVIFYPTCRICDSFSFLRKTLTLSLIVLQHPLDLKELLP